MTGVTEKRGEGFSMRMAFRVSIAALLLGGAVATASMPARVFTRQAEKNGSSLTAVEQEVVSFVSADTIRDVTVKLSSKEMEGRGTGQPGAERSAKYIAERFKQVGLKPAGDGGDYYQKIKFEIERSLPTSSFKVGAAAFKYKEEFVIAPPFPAESKEISGGLVLAGYGVVSPELKRDDLAGIDVKGKIVLALSGKPSNVDAAVWAKAADRSSVLTGLARKGAVGFVIAQVGRATQPYELVASYFSRRRVSLSDPSPDAPQRSDLPPALRISDTAAAKLFAMTATPATPATSDGSFADLKRRAEAGEYVSRDLGKQASISAVIQRRRGPCNNVIGLLEGSDPKLKEQVVVYTAHYDAYGIDADGTIYPGAGDNAIGVGKLIAIAEALVKSKFKPRRSVMFMALTGEEYGLLGAEHWVWHPTWPLEKVAANINFDGIGSEAWGPLGFVLDLGAGHSDLNNIFKDVAASKGITILPDPDPSEGFFYRSDHYSFVKRGVPALYLVGGPQGNPFEIMKRVSAWLVKDYHQATDTVQPDWNWDGARALSALGMVVGMRVATQEAMPSWMPSSPYNQPRGAMPPPAVSR